MKPRHYQLRLEPDLESFSFKGNAEIQFESDDASDRVVLNSLELEIFSCKARIDQEWLDCRFSVDPAKETLEVTLPEAVSGRMDLRIEYTGVINDKMAGFYRSAYARDGQSRHIAVTQFEESDARRAFPCMDHPLYKASFDIDIIADQRLSVLSNEDVAAETPLDNGKKSVRFLRTPKMSTYLLFFGVGEFEAVRDAQDERVIGAALPGRSDYLGFGVAFGRKALAFCEDYFDVPYPLSKMHLIAVPDFAFGAMENWGAITFRENLLLHYPGVTSGFGAQRICEVVAHEIVHQWFGNLVTPSDWRYLWLNESFATYFGYGVVDHYYPEWGTWDQFLLGQTDMAMNRDALHETFPIEIPGGEHVIINSSTAPIIYSKGGSLLRQIQGYIGPNNFQAGLRRYLKTHPYGCAASHHLWEAFEMASDRPVTDMVHRWIEQPGFPLVEARRDGDRLTLSQERFTYLQHPSDALWPIPVVLESHRADGDARRQVVLLEERMQTVDLAPGTLAVKVNAGQTGFYRTHYPNPGDLDALGALVETKSLGPEDRWGLQNDIFSLVQAGRMPFDDYLKMIERYDGEDAFLPLSSIDANLFGAYLVLDEKWRSRIAQKGSSLALKTLGRIGYLPAADEAQTISMLREQLLWHSAVYGQAEVLAFAGEQFQRLIRGEPLHPDIAKSVMQVGAFMAGESAFAWLCRHMETTPSEHERLNALNALGCLGQADLIEKAGRYTLDRVPDRNRFIPLVAMAANPRAVTLLWEWYTAHVGELETFHPMLYERVIAGIVPVAGMQDPAAVRSFFDTYLKEKPLAADIIRLSLEKLEINLNLRQAATR